MAPAAKRLKVSHAPRPRIHCRLRVGVLREEAIVRGFNAEAVLKMLKPELLEKLVSGSIHLKESPEFKQSQHEALEALKKEMEDELPSLRAKNIEDQKRRAERPPIVRSTWFYGVPGEGADSPVRKFQFPKAQNKGKENISKAQSKARRGSETRRFHAALAAMDRHNKAMEDASNLPLLTEQETEERRAKYDIRQFTNESMNPPKESKTFRSDGGFTVWCSECPPPDDIKSYMGPPAKTFDTTWETKEAANLRAKYLFFHIGMWGVPPDELFSTNQFYMNQEQGLVTLNTFPVDANEWTVGVMSDEAFAKDENSCFRRHTFDGDDVDSNDDEISSGAWYVARPSVVRPSKSFARRGRDPFIRDYPKSMKVSSGRLLRIYVTTRPAT